MILIILSKILIFPSLVFGSNEKIYYCSDEKLIGFRPSKNYKVADFIPIRFKLYMYVKEKKIKSAEILFTGNPSWDFCMTNKKNKELYCYNQIGSSFALNTKTLKYHRSYIINTDTPEDDIRIGHGKCEIF